eukprot:4426129-Pyramimonas_sp.AAC.1
MNGIYTDMGQVAESDHQSDEVEFDAGAAARVRRAPGVTGRFTECDSLHGPGDDHGGGSAPPRVRGTRRRVRRLLRHGGLLQGRRGRERLDELLAGAGRLDAGRGHRLRLRG